MESPENNSAVFRPSHKPWKSIKPIPTFPPPRRPRAKYEIIPKRSRPRCPPQTRRSGSFLDWKRLIELFSNSASQKHWPCIALEAPVEIPHGHGSLNTGRLNISHQYA